MNRILIGQKTKNAKDACFCCISKLHFHELININRISYEQMYKIYLIGIEFSAYYTHETGEATN